MSRPSQPTTDVAFTPSVKALQEKAGSRRAYARLEAKGGWPSEVDPQLAAFIAERDSLYFATASSDGQPYVQHRGGPPGFLKVLDARTLAFEDLEGNRQYISAGNLADNPKAFIFLMDYENRRRIKLWGKARVDLQGGKRTIVFEISAWDVNCPQHIPRKYDARKVQSLLEEAQRRQGGSDSVSTP
ncbi:MAG TPA: pyridoxamine 5'-phosphate oxidase family protein [Burkholderiales bacterium]|jgi:hypothetical protein